MSKKRVKLIRMEDPYTNLKNGDMGTIVGTDPLGNILVNWDNGSRLHLLPGVDEYDILENVITKFEKFILESKSSDIGFLEVKFEEISDLISSYKGIEFEWYIVDDESNIFGASLSTDSKRIEWTIDLNIMSLEKSVISSGVNNINTNSKISSIEESFYLIEEEIHNYLNI